MAIVITVVQADNLQKVKERFISGYSDRVPGPILP